MKTILRTAANKIWDRFFEEAKTELFKAEVLQDYYGEDKGPSLDAWLAGDKAKSKKLLIADSKTYADFFSNLEAKPVRKIWTHVVKKPYTPYMQWELEAYKLDTAKVTELYLVPSDRVVDLDIPDGDFWIFDQKRVIRWHYKNTQVISGDVYDESDDIGYFLKLRENFLKYGERFKV